MINTLPWLRSIAVALIAMLALPAHAGGGRPGDPEFVVVKAGRVITVSGEDIERGEIVMVDGRITLVGVGLKYPKTATVIEARDLVVMPGLINARTNTGVPGIIRRGINGAAAADKDIVYDDIDFAPLIRHGFTTAVLQPRGSGVVGMASAFATAADEPWKRSIDRESYLLITFGGLPNDKNTLREAITKAREEIKKAEEARKKFDEEQAKKKAEFERKAAEAKRAAEANKDAGQPAPKPEEFKPDEYTPPVMNPDLAPVVRLLQKSEQATPAMFELSSAAGLTHLTDALTMLKEGESFEHFLCLPRPGSSDFSFVVDDLASRGVGVLMAPEMATLPQTVTRYHLAGELVLRGVKVGFIPGADNEFGYQRHLDAISELVRLGLPREEALKSATLHVASILGLERRLGSIEVGKTGNLLFLTADPLDPAARISKVMVRGVIVHEPEN